MKLVQAFHTNTTPGEGDEPFSAETGTSIGLPAGLVINIGGVTVYHAGDTCLFGDMKLIAERTPLDVAIVPIGGHYTMGVDDAAYACGLLGAKTVLPMHYGTFPAIEADAGEFKRQVEGTTSAEVVLLEPGRDALRLSRLTRPPAPPPRGRRRATGQSQFTAAPRRVQGRAIVPIVRRQNRSGRHSIDRPRAEGRPSPRSVSGATASRNSFDPSQAPHRHVGVGP